MTRTPIKDFYGKIIGSLEEDDDKILAKDFYGKILGRYDKKTNTTKDFFGKIIATGNIVSSLIWQANAEHEAKLKQNRK